MIKDFDEIFIKISKGYFEEIIELILKLYIEVLKGPRPKYYWGSGINVKEEAGRWQEPEVVDDSTELTM